VEKKMLRVRLGFLALFFGLASLVFFWCYEIGAGILVLSFAIFAVIPLLSSLAKRVRYGPGH